VQGRNSFARFDARLGEDYADGLLGGLSLFVGFSLQAIGYVLVAHGGSEAARSPGGYLVLVGSGVAAFGLTWFAAGKLRPRIRNQWLIEYARFDDYGYRHELPNGRVLFMLGRVLDSPPLMSEVSGGAEYARRVFNAEVRDTTRDHEVRPHDFQPFAPVDDARVATRWPAPSLFTWLLRRP
jgi:hypothetical protein